MGDTNFRGPIVSMGSLEVEAGTSASIEPFDGPSAAYQGYAFLDVRALPYLTEGLLPGRVPAFLSGSFIAVDNKPQAAASTVVAASQACSTSLFAMALATVGVNGFTTGTPNVTVAVPIMPQGTSNVTTAAIALDFGFITGTTTAASSAVVVSDNTQLNLGQWILIGGAGNSANTASQFTQVVAISTTNTTGINVSPAPAGTLSNAPIGQANLYGAGLIPPGTQFGPATASAFYHSPNMQAGLLRVHNPKEMLARNLQIQLATGGTATSVAFLVTGWDVWRQPMSELITVPATTSATTAYGQKAFKYVSAVVPQSNPAGNTYAVGIADVFGFPCRADEFEQTEMYWNGCTVPTSLGFTAAATTAPATNTTGDVRGTIQVSTSGKGSAASVATAAVSNGTSRLVIIQDTGVWNMVFGTPNNTVPMFGVANSTN
jgi:hypothetical protein